MTKDIKKAKVIFNKSGGTASRNGITNRVTIPTSWIQEMGITHEDREVILRFENGVITIEKCEDDSSLKD